MSKTLVTSSLTNSAVPPPHQMKSVADWLKAMNRTQISKNKFRFPRTNLIPAMTHKYLAIAFLDLELSNSSIANTIPKFGEF
ncbi:hypothetical protein A2U01_0052745 [Trifolium medium]|uniref:Uncharacterized protein n=1 Tax=Trifolium medium TaxID=97028 RepID=A0A392R4M9_9FABA|nr:hypothetical protein [Trifolium medium]